MNHLTFPIVQAVVDGTQSGKIYNHGNHQLIIHKSGFGQLFSNSGSFNENDLLHLLTRDTLPAYFHLYAAQPEVVRFVVDKSNEFGYKVRNRILLRYAGGKVPIVKYEDYTYEQINDSVFELYNKATSLQLSSKFWSDKEDFIKNAFAVGLRHAHEVVCICYSAANARGISEIDIWTHDNYRGKGFAKATAAMFINHCLDMGTIPEWDCFEENKASLRTAFSLGFTNCENYNFLSIFRKNAH